jgi:hypothetical protein
LEKIEYSGQSVEELSQNYKNLDIEDLWLISNLKLIPKQRFF